MPLTSSAQPAMDLVRDWAARANTCEKTFEQRPPRLAATRLALNKCTGIQKINRFCKIMRRPMPPGTCTTICFIDAQSTPFPAAQPGAPVFLLSYIRSFARTGWPSTVQVMGRPHGEEEYTYMGRYEFLPTAVAPLPKDEWDTLPHKVRHLWICAYRNLPWP